MFIALSALFLSCAVGTRGALGRVDANPTRKIPWSWGSGGPREKRAQVMVLLGGVLTGCAAGLLLGILPVWAVFLLVATVTIPYAVVVHWHNRRIAQSREESLPGTS